MKAHLLAALSIVVFWVIGAQGQQFDVDFGVHGVTATSSTNAGPNYTPQTVGGGTFLSFGGDFLFKRNLGVQAEVSFRAKQNLYLGFQPFRPIFYDFNGIWAPPLGKKAQAEVMGGIGALSTRFYQPTFTCNFFGCTNSVSSNHFLGHVGGGLRYFFGRSLFIGPEAHFYFIRNNFEFSGPWADRFGVTLGYAFRSTM